MPLSNVQLANIVDKAKLSRYSAGLKLWVKGKFTALDNKIGTLPIKTPAAEGQDAVYYASAIEYIDALIANQNAAGAVTVSEVNTGLADGILKAYKIYQGGEEDGNLIGTINIPKDLVVTKGSCVKGTWDGDTFTESVEGTGHAIKLEIANQTAPVYVNTLDLVDIYTAQQNATQIQLTVGEDNVISAVVVAKSITNTELSDAVNLSLGKADTALQSISGETGEGALLSVGAKGEGETTQAISATKKLQDAVVLAEGSVQSVAEGTSVETYVKLTVSGTDETEITIDDTDLNNKIGAQYVPGETPTAASGLYNEIQGATTATVKDCEDALAAFSIITDDDIDAIIADLDAE